MKLQNILACAPLLLATAVQAVDLVKNKQPVAKLYLEQLDKSSILPSNQELAKMPITEQQDRILSTAVADLNYHFEKMSGTKLEIVITSDPGQIKSPAIVIGKLANKIGAAPKNTSELGETFRIKTSGDMLLIGGETPSGTAYGIYELLERLGCDWVMPGPNGEVIPQLGNISISELDIEQSPSFSVRYPWYSGGAKTITEKDCNEFAKWKLRHKEQLSLKLHPAMMEGGHVWDTIFKRYKKEFEKNPEMLALVRQSDGTFKRQGPQLETTNPEVLDLFADYIRNMFKKNNWPNDKSICIGVGPADGEGFSESPETLLAGTSRIDPVSGSQDITDLQVLLCNQLIKKLEPEFPNLRLGFYLYSVHADYPMRYTPDPKITIVIADITYSRLHGLGDKNSKTRAYYKEILEQWSKLQKTQGNNIFFRGYNWNLAENFLPYTKLKIWGEDIPYYKKMGVIGFYNECTKAWSVLGPSEYLEAKLTWNVNLDWKKVLAQYCKSAFGNGAPFLEQYYLTLAQKQSESGYEAGSYHSVGLIYNEDFVKDSLELFKKAENAAETASQKQRVRFARIPVEMLGLYLAFRKNYSSFNFAAAQQKFEEMKSELQKYEDIDQNLICRNSIRYLDRFYKGFIEKANEYSSGKYSIESKIPDKLKTAFDSNNSGQSMRLFAPEINDENYITTATYSSTWDAQGLMGYRSGSVWYRTIFDLTPEQANKTLGLFVGGADSIVRVWCNGEYIAMGQGFAKPFLFDLSKLTRPGKNLIAIQVQRFGNSEIGTGGLVYPSFIFAGPRLESPAPKQEKQERMLPGGERAPAH